MRPEVPHHLRAFQVALRQTLLSVDKVREFERVTDEKHRSVVTNNVPVAFFGVELQGETTRIAFGISRTTLAPHRGEAQEGLGLLADIAEQLGAAVLGDIAGHREGAIGTRALGVHTALWDVLAVEVRELLDQMEVIQQQRATRACRTRILVISDRCTAGGGQYLGLAHVLSPYRSQTAG
ncbi:hypothetical protein D3C77_526230 [compost metagenome]